MRIPYRRYDILFPPRCPLDRRFSYSETRIRPGGYRPTGAALTIFSGKGSRMTTEATASFKTAEPMADKAPFCLTPDTMATIVIFGATGDLTERKLLPALYNLWAAELLPQRFAVVG